MTSAILRRALLPIGLTLLSWALSASAQINAQTAAQTATGKWLGIFDVVNADGSVDPGTAFLSLNQTGSQLAGSAGDSATHLSPITTGAAANHHLTFTLAVNPTRTVNFDLQQEGEQLVGTATGLPADPGAVIRVHAIRADDSWHVSTPVPHETDHLFENVANLDKRLFDAYNTCDLNTLGSLVTEDLEFYHDKTGLALGRATFLNAIQNNICGKTHRTLTPGSLEVHRLAHYGAVEIGLHTFSHPGSDLDQGQAKFTTLWRYKDGAWQMTRAISYDHEPLKQ